MPSVRFANNFFLVLTLLADAAVVLGVVGALAAAASRRTRAVVLGAVELVGPWSIAIAFVVAAVTTAGSLYYSESAGFTPCVLCWYQRIVMYPLVVVLLVAWLRRDRAAWITAAPFVVVGAPLSFYHWLVERVPSLAEGISCSLDAPCAVTVIRFDTPRKSATKVVVGSSYKSCGGPTCSTRPALITAMRSLIVSASSWSCVT